MTSSLDREDWLVSTDWLAENLDSVRVVDSTVFLRLQDDGSFQMENGRTIYEKEHIPGAVYADVSAEFAEPNRDLAFAWPSPERFAQSAGALGLANDQHIVVYSADHVMWATRMWWLLRAHGHDRVSVLDGGLGKWKDEGRPVSNEVPKYPATEFRVALRPEMVASQDDVTAALEAGSHCVLNALPAPMHKGAGPSPYARPGRIAGSESLPAFDIVGEDGAFVEKSALQEKLSDKLGPNRAITYCGGGIAATATAFALSYLGKENVAVYDGSLQEWSANPDLPMEVG